MTDPIDPGDRIAPLDPRLLELLRASHTEPSAAREQARLRLAGLLVEPSSPVHPPGDPVGVARAGGRLLRGAGTSAPVALAAAFLAGGVTGAAIFAALEPAPAARIVYVDRPGPAAPSAAPPPVAAPRLPSEAPTSAASTAPAPVSAEAPPAAREASSAAATNAPPPGHATSAPTASSAAALRASRFSEERMLLDEARAALVQGDPARALQRLGDHRARFPDGLLAEERDAMEVQALVRAGRFDEARAEAARFRARAPSSLFLPTVESAIESIP